MKIATWNVNGIRARQAQLQEFLDREAPDVVCLQEIKASPDQLPSWLCEMEGYWCYWHGGKGYSGVGLHVSRRVSPDRPEFVAPGLRLRAPDRAGPSARRVGGLGLRPERRQGLPGQGQVPGCPRGVRRRTQGRWAAAGDLRRSEHRPYRDGRAPEGAQAGVDRPASRRARAARADDRPTAWSTSAVLWNRTTTSCSPGGRRGGTCGSATSAGASITSSPASRSSTASARRWCSASSGPAITPRSSPSSISNRRPHSLQRSQRRTTTSTARSMSWAETHSSRE